RSPDAPWHHARPAFDEPEPQQPPSTSEHPTSAPDQPDRSEEPKPDQPRPDQPQPDEPEATAAENEDPADPADASADRPADDRTDPAGGPQ
ncbi:NADH-quinone oxidoreductase subunit C, partial [Streptomyces muensis]|nr:NADH-quinone oxidoreductase subunit C [Streptomyces muensis]